MPNHLPEQFAREFIQLYPNAKLLVAAKEDLSRERRKVLTAKIASGDWDGIIVTHSSFERIGRDADPRTAVAIRLDAERRVEAIDEQMSHEERLKAERTRTDEPGERTPS